jgi:hypothetical protein
MADATLPTREEIARLPRWARIAFAARCARRVFPLFSYQWKSAPKALSDAVSLALESAEATAARKGANASRASAAANRATAAASSARSVEAPLAAVAVADAASAAACAARAALADLGTDDDYDPLTLLLLDDTSADAASAAVIAADYAGVANGHIVAAIRRDCDIVASLTRSEHWTDNTPVPAEVFGPPWPDGPPPGWPGSEPSSGKSGLLLVIEVPEGLSGERVLELIAGCASKADALDRAYGGHGLELDEGDIEVESWDIELTPAGGSS